MNQFHKVGIAGTGSYLPQNVVTNFDLEKLVDTTNEWIVSRTGISERRYAGDDFASSDLAYEASIRALDSAGLTPMDLDLIIVATVTPDMMFPSTACILQEKLGATRASAFDLEAACSGFLYSLSVGRQFVMTGTYNNVLVVGVDKLTSIMDKEDRNTSVLFGDGAGAVILSKATDSEGILSVELGADGTGGKFLYMPAGGSKKPASFESISAKEHFIKMDGSEVFKFAVRVMGKASTDAIEKAGLKFEDIDYLVPHQANIRIIEAAAKRIGLPMEKVKVNLDKYGNISAASIPIALDEAVRENNIKKGDNVVLVGFGGGLTWGACVINW
jgi:3-oxoacyl-[acyl-carrier-protein] synthase-3